MAPGRDERDAIVPELIEVRSDERFDEARLADYLRDRLPGADRPLQVRQFGGGHANLTYLLRYGGPEDEPLEYVLRRPPLGPVAKGAHDMKREHRALSVLWQSFPVAPRAFLYCEASDIIGADFFVMERRRGVVVRRVVPPEFGGGRDPEANRKLSEVLIDTLVDFHAIDAEDAGLGDLGKPDGFLRRQVEGWANRFERSKTREIEIANELHEWLIDNLPASLAPTLLHNDWKLDNMAMAADDPGRCVAVYDWDMCTRGDPLCDLASLMTSWRDEEETVLAMPTTSPGFLRRAEAIARYGERSGRSLADISYYLVFGVFKNAVVLQQIYYRYAQGQTVDERFAGMGEGAVELFQRAARLRD